MSYIYTYICVSLLAVRLQVGSDGSSWVPGFFDRNSYQEYLSGWGKSIVVGRARIGGISMGVINVETRLSEQVNGTCVVMLNRFSCLLWLRFPCSSLLFVPPTYGTLVAGDG